MSIFARINYAVKTINSKPGLSTRVLGPFNSDNEMRQEVSKMLEQDALFLGEENAAIIEVISGHKDSELGENTYISYRK